SPARSCPPPPPPSPSPGCVSSAPSSDRREAAHTPGDQTSAPATPRSPPEPYTSAAGSHQRPARPSRSPLPSAPASNPYSRPAEMENVAASTGSTRAPMAKASATGVPGADANLRPKYMAPAAIGVSPALMSGHLVYAPPPSYPMMAQMTHIQGRVTVEAVVGKSGRVI